MAKQPPKPPFPDRATALLWVGCNRLTGLHMILSGGVLIALGTIHLATRRHPLVPVDVGLIVLGSLIALCGIPLTMRRTPALSADERGVMVDAPGIVRSLLPWELIDGAEVVGKKKAEQHLVLLTHDVEAALKHLNPMLASSVQRMNTKWKRQGALYILGKAMADPPGVVAERIKAIIGESWQPETD